jgi:hypothetical protein
LFGLVARPSGGHTRLGAIYEGMTDFTLTRRVSLNAYVGHMRGGAVVRSVFRGDRLWYGYVETVLSY